MAYIYHKFLFYTVHLLQFFFWMLYILEVKRKIFFNGHATGPWNTTIQKLHTILPYKSTIQ